MIICNNHKILYYDMPKTGSVSFEEYFRRNYEGRYLPSGAFSNFDESMTLDQRLIRIKHRREPPEGTEDFVKVATVRNPFDRISSMFFFYANFRQKMAHLNDQVVLDIVNPMQLDSFDSFLDYCIDITESSDKGSFRENLCYPCSKYMEHEDSYHVIRIENAIEDMKQLPFYNPEHVLGHYNRFDDYPKWSDLRTEERRRKVVRWAEQDFVNFSYNTK